MSEQQTPVTDDKGTVIGHVVSTETSPPGNVMVTVELNEGAGADLFRGWTFAVSGPDGESHDLRLDHGARRMTCRIPVSRIGPGVTTINPSQIVDVEPNNPVENHTDSGLPRPMDEGPSTGADHGAGHFLEI